MSQLTKEFGGVRSVDHISFRAEEGKLTTLLGPSGCGKTTTLRMIAGLETPTSGEIWLGDNLVCAPAKRVHVASERRNIGMVFQSYAIWPHMSAFDNVAYPLIARGKSNMHIRTKVSRMFALLRLHGLEDRYPNQLSGGQQQRVALARALVYEPKVLLLDEPLANLDAKIRESVRFELKALQTQLRFTAIYVTHDQSEAMGLSDKIIVLDRGQIIQEGTPTQIYESPVTRFVAEFVGHSNILVGRPKSLANGQCSIAFEDGYAIFVKDSGYSNRPEIAVCIRPESFMMASIISTAGGLEGRVTGKEYLGNLFLYRVALRNAQVQVQVDPASDKSYEEGQRVFLAIRDNRVHVLSDGRS